jgi:MFS family permease
MGYSGGSERPASSCYTAEICDPDIRKFTGAFGMVLYTIGYAVVYLLGVFLNWRDILSVIMGLPLICAIALYACPESPTWLLIKEKPEEAFTSMLRLRGSKEAAQEEIKKLETNMKEQKLLIDSLGTDSYFIKCYKVFKQPTFLRPFLILIVLMGFGMQFTGAPPLAFYLVPIFQKSNIPISSYLAAASLSCFRLIIVIISTLLSSVVPRRPLLMITLFITATGALLLGTNAYLDKQPWFNELQSNYPVLKWVPLISIFLIYAGFSGGLGPVIQILVGELLPSNLRSFGIGLISVFSMGTLFLVLKLTPLAQEAIGLDGMYWIFAICGFLLMVFTFFVIPETFGRSLEDIEDHYRRLCYGDLNEDITSNGDIQPKTSNAKIDLMQQISANETTVHRRRMSLVKIDVTTHGLSTETTKYKRRLSLIAQLESEGACV